MVDKIRTIRCIRDATRATKDAWKEAFISLDDITGYAFATEYCEGGYPLWQSITNSRAVKKEITQWMTELEIKLQSRGLRLLAVGGTVEAAKWLASRGWLPPEDKRTKESKKKAAVADAEVQKDFDRMGIHLVKTSAKKTTAA